MDKNYEYVCLYSVVYNNSDGDNKIESGLIYASSFTHAVRILEENLYGVDLVKILSVELYDTTAVFSNSTMELIRKELQNNEC